MSSRPSTTRRHRSSTTKSRNVPPIDGNLALLETIIQRSASHDATSTVNQHQISPDLDDIVSLFSRADDLEIVQDQFRRLHGFQALLKILSECCARSEVSPINGHVSSSEIGIHVQIFLKVLNILLHAFREHEGNRRYFVKRLKPCGWTVLEDHALRIRKVVSAVVAEDVHQKYRSIFSALFALSYSDTRLFDLFNTYDTTSQSAEAVKDGQASAEDQLTGREAASLLGLDNLTAFLTESRYEQMHISNPEAMKVVGSLYTQVRSYEAADEKKHDSLDAVLLAIEKVSRSSLSDMVMLQKSGILSPLLSYLLTKGRPVTETELLTKICENLLAMGIEDLEDAALLFRHGTSNSTARGLLQTAVKELRQPPCIQFDLSRSGHSAVEFSSLPRSFPPNAGYTLTAWIRIDEFDPKSHTTLFGAFDSSQTCFVLVYLEKDSRQLILQTSVTSSRPSVRFRSMQFRQSSWCHIALVQRPHKSSDPSQCSLYVNGRYVESRSCLYPQTPPAVQVPPPSAPFPPDVSKRRPVQAFFGTPQELALQSNDGPVKSRWSLANAHLFDDCLSADMIAVHHQLGNAYCGNFQDHVGQLLTYRASAQLNRYNEELHLEKADRSEIVTAIQQRGSEIMPESSILLSVSATAVASMDGVTGHSVSFLPTLVEGSAHAFRNLVRNGNSILFSGAKPAINDALARSYGTGILTGQSTTVIPQGIDDAGWRIGGSLALSMKLLQTASKPSEILSAVDTLLSIVQNSWRISEVMEKENGYGVVALLIREKLGVSSAAINQISSKGTPGSINQEETQELALGVMKLVLEFIGCRLASPRDSLLINPMAFRVFLVDFDTWRVASSATQRLYYQQLTSFLHGNKNYHFNAKRFSKMRMFLSSSKL